MSCLGFAGLVLGMTVHLVKMAVGVDSVAHLSDIQTLRRRRAGVRGGLGELRHMTRHAPRRMGELLDDGSIFWVIKRFICVRQRILGLDHDAVRDDGRPACALILDPRLVRTELRASRAFQGWRYLTPGVAPADARVDAPRIDDVPPEMAAELRALGLL
jgi:hypothetical protein